MGAAEEMEGLVLCFSFYPSPETRDAGNRILMHANRELGDCVLSQACGDRTWGRGETGLGGMEVGRTGFGGNTPTFNSRSCSGNRGNDRSGEPSLALIGPLPLLGPPCVLSVLEGSASCQFGP